MPRVAITGAHGYVGSVIANAFRQGGWSVTALSRLPAADGVIPFALGERVANLSGLGIQALVHAAYDFSLTRWEEIDRINVHGTQILFDAAKSAGVERILLISTLSAFEGTRSLYGRAKLAMEQLALSFGGSVVRPGLVYGERAGGMTGALEQTVQTQRIIPVLSHGRSKLYLVHADDLATLIVRLTEAPVWPPTPRITTAAGQRGWTLQGILRAFARGMNRRIVAVPLPWQFVWLGLRVFEAVGIRLKYRSDSVLSLSAANPEAAWKGSRSKAVQFREFSGTDQ